MGRRAFPIKHLVAVAVASFLFAPPVSAQEAPAQEMLEDLRAASPEEAERLAGQIRTVWSKSGSAAMDLLLRRGRDAIEAEDHAVAVEHLTALTDHAPEFAEGWATRAMAFFQQQEYGLALADLRRALALNPEHFGALYGLGAIMEQLDRPRLAWRAYEEVLAIYPHHPQVGAAMERLEREVLGAEL